jgi:hypothetical protein
MAYPSRGGRSDSPGWTPAAIREATETQSRKRSAAIAQVNDQKAAQYFAVAVAGLIALFTILHWSRLIYSRYVSKKLKDSKIIKAQSMVAR